MPIIMINLLKMKQKKEEYEIIFKKEVIIYEKSNLYLIY